MTRKIVRELKREFPFAEIEITRGGHLRLRLPNGRIVIVASTPRRPLSVCHLRTVVRRQMRRRSSPSTHPHSTPRATQEKNRGA
jgi:hypothetical protein